MLRRCVYFDLVLCPFKKKSEKVAFIGDGLSSGMCCMAMFAAFPSTIMDSTTMGRAHPLLWRRPKAASIMVDGNEANIAIQLIPNERPSSMKATFLEIEI